VSVSDRPTVAGAVSVTNDIPGPLPSVYFSRGYGEAGLDGAKRWMCVVDPDGRWILPVILSPIRDSEKLEAISPYGYAGIYVDPSLSDAEVDERWSATEQLLRDSGVVSLFLRFAPFDEGSAARSARLGGLAVRAVSETILVATRSEDDVWAALRGRARTAIRKAASAGLTASFRTATADDVAAGSPFRRLYEWTMSRVDAAPDYLFPQDYYDGLLSGLGDALKVCTVSGPGGEVVAACLIMADEETFHYHLSGSDPEGAQAGANNLLIWEVLRAAVAEGKTRVHLGGGVTPGDSLHRFKESFGGEALSFRVGSAVIDEEEYRGLVDRRAAELGATPDELLASAYFPAFRATVGSR